MIDGGRVGFRRITGGPTLSRALRNNSSNNSNCASFTYRASGLERREIVVLMELRMYVWVPVWERVGDMVLCVCVSLCCVLSLVSYRNVEREVWWPRQRARGREIQISS